MYFFHDLNKGSLCECCHFYFEFFKKTEIDRRGSEGAQKLFEKICAIYIIFLAWRCSGLVLPYFHFAASLKVVELHYLGTLTVVKFPLSTHTLLLLWYIY